VFQILAGFDREGSPGAFGATDELVDGDFSLTGEELIFGRSLEGFEEMAEKSRAAGQLLRECAKTGASPMDGPDGQCAVKIVEGFPL
jgi:hypothetical protein